MSERVTGRRSGRTTRFIDEAIQELFKIGSINLKESFEFKDDASRVMSILQRRLMNEHGSTGFEFTQYSVKLKK
jgi:hypothetical protein